ncbi:MAG: pseudouridine synthase [Chloroflexota bacterium]|nr:pseudouridine synthase [Chloroflexota bacterium]
MVGGTLSPLRNATAIPWSGTGPDPAECKYNIDYRIDGRLHLAQSNMKSKTLLKLLVNAGAGSRRQIAEAIIGGSVQVNGEVIESLSHPVDVTRDIVTLNGEKVDLKLEPRVYLMLNKPADTISTTKDDRGRRTAIDMLPPKYHHLNLHPVGRLDRNSTGLLLLTNDGEFTYRLTHPKFKHEKEYLVFIEGRLQPHEEKKLREGIQLEGGMTHPAVIKEVKAFPPFNYSIIIHEGRKRQVRRMFEKLGHSVVALKRVRIGSLSMGNLEEGQVRELSLQEVRILLQC